MQKISKENGEDKSSSNLTVLDRFQRYDRFGLQSKITTDVN